MGRARFRDGWHGRAAGITAAILAAPVLGGPVLYVDDDAPPGGTGESWTQALRFPQDALALALNQRGAVTEIRLAQGVYRPDLSSANPRGTRDRDASFRLVDGVAIRGGYLGLSAGPCGHPDQRDISRYPTILSGDLAGDDGPEPFQNNAENSYHVVVALNVGRSALLEGVSIVGGRADGPGLGPVPESRDQGSAVNVYFAQPTFIQCAFRGNWAINHGTINDHGSATVIQCLFRDNFSAGHGAGLYMHHESDTTAVGCQFINNHATTDGGGAYSASMTRASLTGCTFIGNLAQRGAGMYTAALSTTTVRDCVFADNVAGSGGGMYNDSSSPMIIDCMYCGNQAQVGAGVVNGLGQAVLMGCSFLGNVAAFGDPTGGGGGGGSGGGGVWNEGGAATLIDCEFAGNLASFGGGVYNGGGALPIITDCAFSDNHTSEGAAVYNLFSDAVISRCVFTGNTATGGVFPVGGAVSNYVCSPRITDCVFEHNAAELGGGAVYVEVMNPVLANCLFRGNRALYGGAMLNGFFAASVLSNCTIVENAADRPRGAAGVAGAGGAGGAVQHFLSSSRIANCIVWSNGVDPIALDGSSSSIVLHSVVEGGWAGRGTANLETDPVFVDASEGDFRLGAGSPAIDAGRNGDVPDRIVLDLAGLPRFVDDPVIADCHQIGADCGTAPIVDIGAYERQVMPADLDGDGDVDGIDLAVLLGQWGPCRACPADLDGNGFVNGVDLALLLGRWGHA